ncbi:LamB/YcsF family protein [Nocardia farcinica]|uniref:5-oxoprolinase subunit A n=1 Tax=Nocardia farcinica (strain IFM 10152) TaxID=247156 RepID=PXPA_NOCFA|nr:5-oxoprolinase subunit PxpA [Nocardia farcinica]Q5YMT5.1 RecName: Full=5-oxoprolinase subunit A; Short=5-OPase subunit A; AltName: Full=5-oxoprolinase (ATP-hydrolyzing) subunit A [Nocardia farcinica IFM 10152]BAD60506.1 putative lactam utilization protein [Nocardia farcinica IFM 10152]
MPLDLNSDLGEGFGSWTMGDDAAMLDLVTSANIACGFHAGDPSIMRRTCALAAERGVRIGAHVGHRDLVGFGRRRIEIDPADLRDEVLYQIGALDGFARAAGSRVSYVKPHGALYHSAAARRDLADAVLAAMTDLDPKLVLLGPAGTELEHAATAAGVRFIGEGFADRAYTPEGRLAPRGRAGAVLDADAAVAQAVAIATEGRARVVEGGTVEVGAGSVCVHGDTPAAVEMARRIRDALAAAGVVVEAFV